MKKNLLISILIYSCCLFCCSDVSSQDTSLVAPKIFLGYDISKTVSYLLDSENFGQEITIGYTTRKNKDLFLDLGYFNGKFERNNYDLKIRSPYFRFGFGKPVIKEGNDILSYKLGLGTVHFSNTYFNDSITDIYFGSIPLGLESEKLFAVWGEAMLVLKVKLSQKIAIGWSTRLKIPFYFQPDSYFKPYYVPGYGKTNGSISVGFNYYIFYIF